MIRDFREKYNISEADLNNEISNRLSDIDIKLDNNAKNYNLKTINELLVQQKLLTNLKNKMNNNEEVYVRKQQGGASATPILRWFVNSTNEEFKQVMIKAPNFPGPISKIGIIILDLQSVLKYKPSGNVFANDKVLDELTNKLLDDKNDFCLLNIICDDNWSWETVIKEIPTLKNITYSGLFHKVSGFSDIKNCVTDILKIYSSMLTDDTYKDNLHIYYISRNWNKYKQIRDLNKSADLKLVPDTDDENIYNDNNIKVQFMDKNNVSTSGNYMDQLPTVRSIRESIKNPEWMSPFLIDKNHFKSLMTRLKVDDNGKFLKY